MRRRDPRDARHVGNRQTHLHRWSNRTDARQGADAEVRTMEVLVDTNIVLDFLLERDPSIRAANLLFEAIAALAYQIARLPSGRVVAQFVFAWSSCALLIMALVRLAPQRLAPCIFA